ncbi:T9SS type A sorting domain-containing protein [Bacteroidota bacterium]
MKLFKTKFKFSFILTVLFFALIINANADTLTVQVGNGGSNFSPQNVNAVVGDFIKWVHVAGFHTTTCDPNTRPLTNLPSGAQIWNEPMNASQIFIYEIQVAGLYEYECIPHSPFMNGTINASLSNVNLISQQVPESFKLSQNYPNPFNPSTSIKFSLPNSSFTTLKVYNLVGQEIETLVNENLNAGTYEATLNGANLTSGIYFYKINADGYSETKKMMLIK